MSGPQQKGKIASVGRPRAGHARPLPCGHSANGLYWRTCPSISQWSGPIDSFPQRGKAALNKSPPPATLPAPSPSPHSPPSPVPGRRGRRGRSAASCRGCGPADIPVPASGGWVRCGAAAFLFGLVHTNHLFRHYFRPGLPLVKPGKSWYSILYCHFLRSYHSMEVKNQSGRSASAGPRRIRAGSVGSRHGHGR